MLGGTLAWVAVVVNDVDAAAGVFERDFRLPRTDCAAGGTDRSVPVFAVGQSAIAVFGRDDDFLGETPARTGVHHIALGAPDLVAATRAAAAAGVPPAEPPTPGLQGRRRLRLSTEATAGVNTYLAEPLELRRDTDGWVERIDHIGVASEDNASAIETFTKRLGCPLESTQTDLEVRIAVESFTSDKYGAVYHSREPEPVGGLRVAFITVGDCELEFLQDFDPRHGADVKHGAPGTTKQDQGAIARFVSSRGPGLHHLALKVTDINEALSSLAAAGHRVIDRVGRPGSRRALIGFVHPASLGGVLLHLVQR
ncbi:MAG: VOC family protein [Candidatus Rokubacteria bacterium]|nr:VOC family protein [Candidatus Rokubacteria bacterium]